MMLMMMMMMMVKKNDNAYDRDGDYMFNSPFRFFV